MAFARITTDPERMAGLPCIRDLRFPVATVMAMVADGMTSAQILAEHPDPEEEDIREVLRYAGGGRTRARARAANKRVRLLLSGHRFGQLLAASGIMMPPVILLWREPTPGAGSPRR